MIQLIRGDCLEVMATLEENSVDTIITDPPYGLEFMGKDWDHGVPGVPFWTAALRVAKPGAMMLAFGGSRTHHRLMVAIEDAGWEIRDVIMYVYGSGFPKSHDIGKAIDKAVGAEREVVSSERKKAFGYADRPWKHREDANINTITAPATDAARLWDGYGTALKPAYEPIIIAMAPRDGTFANNALTWGVAGINVDAGRVGHNEPEITTTRTADKFGRTHAGGKGWRGKPESQTLASPSPQGRWPANLIHDGSDEVTRLFPMSNGGNARNKITENGGGWKQTSKMKNQFSIGDSGSAARFFKTCPPDRLCVLCDLPMTQRRGIMNEIQQEDIPCEFASSAERPSSPTESSNDSVASLALPVRQHASEGKLAKSSILAPSVAKSSVAMQETTESIALRNAKLKAVEKNALDARYAGSLCASCAIAIAQNLVVTLQGNALELLPGLDSISEHKRQILIQSLALFAESQDNTDIIPTTPSLKLLFGFVQNAIQSYTPTSKVVDGYAPKRLCYHSKASRRERNAGCEGMEEKVKDADYRQPTGNALVDRIHGCGKQATSHHPCVKPLSLMRYLAKLTRTPTSGVVLDPFMGSGTTGMAAVYEDRDFIGIELEPEYFDIATARIQHATDEQKQPRQLDF